MPKHYKEMIDEIINKMPVEEDGAPANAVGGGNIAGAGVGPDGEPGVDKKKKRDPRLFSTLKRNVKENNDNNSVMLKSVLENINKLEKISDKFNNVEEEKVVFEEEKEYKTFKEKYNG